MIVVTKELLEMGEVIKNRWRELSPGGCSMLSEGGNCNCTLCLVANLQIAISNKDPDIPKMPDLVPLKDIERETKEAKAEIEKGREDLERQKEWIKGYDQGYTAGRNGELKRIETLINRYMKGEGFGNGS